MILNNNTLTLHICQNSVNNQCVMLHSVSTLILLQLGKCYTQTKRIAKNAASMQLSSSTNKVGLLLVTSKEISTPYADMYVTVLLEPTAHQCACPLGCVQCAVDESQLAGQRAIYLSLVNIFLMNASFSSGKSDV